MSLQTPEKIRTLQKKLYLKAKAEPDYQRHKVQARGIRRYSSERVFGELGVFLPRPMR